MAYTTLTDLTVNTTLVAGTYYLEVNVNLNSFTLTLDCIEGPIIIKRNGDVYFTNVGVVNTLNSTPLNKVYWTVKDDDTVGETIEGSTGSPSVSGGSFNNAVAITVAITFKYWELRWINDKNFITSNSKNINKLFENIVFKNCYFNSVIVYNNQINYWDGGNSKIKYIDFDSTNTLSGTAILIENNSKMAVNGFGWIYIQNATTSNSPIRFNSFSSSLCTAYKIRIKNSLTHGLYIVDARTTAIFTLIDSCTSIKYELADTGYPVIKNCLFDKNLTGPENSASAVSYITSNKVIEFNIQNCIFRGYTYVFNCAAAYNTKITIRSSVFDRNTNLINRTWRTGSTADYNGYYLNNETGWNRGSRDFTAEPTWNEEATYSGVVVPEEFLKYVPDGYFQGNLTYVGKGHDTWFNLGLNEDSLSPTGQHYSNGNDYITPGINYPVTTFKKTDYHFDINLSSGDSISLLPTTEFRYLPDTFVISGDKDNFASLTSLVQGSQVEMFIGLDKTAYHCSFRDINILFNRHINAINCEDLGNNVGINFTTAPENIAVNVSSGNIQEVSLDEYPYNVTSFFMQGQKGNLASLRSKTLNSPVTIDLTSVGNQSLTYCSFRDMCVTNGTITVINGQDLGGNEGITFQNVEEELTIDLTAGEVKILEPDVNGLPYNVTSFSMIGENGNPAHLVSDVEVVLDLTVVGNQELSFCTFKNIHVINGTITVADGEDFGGNVGITFNSSEIPSDIEINVNENETQILFPKLEPYNVTSFNMIGSNGRPATLKSSVEGTPVILDMSSFPISNLEYCDFKDIELLNGTIVSTNGKDLGGNTGITFQQTEIPEDCVDWKITEELINQLSTMSTGYNTQVKTVQLIESEFKSPDSFPVLIVCPNEIDPDQEYASRNDTLPFALIYIDDSVETNLHYRFRNVPADVQKCLKKNETLNYLAHYVKVDNWENSVFEVGGIEFACCIIYVSVERRLDASDPYRLA